MDEPLFCISNIWSPLCPKHICRVAHERLTLEVLNVRFWSIFVCLYSLFSYTSPSANMYRFSNRCSVLLFFFYRWFFCLLGGLDLSPSVSTQSPQASAHVWTWRAQHPDLSRLIKEPRCLLCSVPPHCAVAILSPDTFCMSRSATETL